MASSLPESWSCMKGGDGFDQHVVPQVNTDLLMFLLDQESHGEDCDDERLRSVIRSLEAEIVDPRALDGRDTVPGEQQCGGGQVDGYDCSTSRDLDFNWMDVEMVPPSPSHDMTNWCVDPRGDEINRLTGDGGTVGDCYDQLCYATTWEEHGFGSLWQEPDAYVMYG